MNGFDFDVIDRSLGYLFQDGMMFTLKLTLLSATGGLILGTLLALCRLSKIPLLSTVAGTYVNLLRALPLILVIFWFYFLVPYIGAWLTGASRPVSVGGFTSALMTFTLCAAACYVRILLLGYLSLLRLQ